MSTETTTTPQAPIEPTPAGGSGGALRQARIDLKLAPEDVAKMLHLSERQIVAIENEEYDKLPGPTYVRGYLRGYAQLLGLSAEPLVESYNRLVAKRKPEDLGKLAPKPEIRSDHQLVKFATIGVVVIVLGLSAVWWQEKPQSVSVAPDEQQEGARTEASDSAPVEPPSDGVTAVDGDTLLPAPIEAEQSASPESSVARESTSTAPSLPVRAAAEQELSLDTSEPATEPAGISPLAPTPTQVASAGPRGSLVLQATLDCWADVRDANGERLLYETIPAGRTVALEGVAPLYVFLGNVEGVKVVFNGQPYDASPHRRGDIARFTLNVAETSR